MSSRFSPKPFSNHIPLHRPGWAAGWEAQIWQACLCDIERKQNSKAGEPNPLRKSELYEWQPTATRGCQVAQLSTHHFCKALGGRQLLLVGDSTIFQLAWTIWNVAQPICHDQIHWTNSDTLIGGCFGNYGRGIPLENAVSDLIKNGTYPDLLLIGVGAHIYRHKCHYPPYNRLGASCQAAGLGCKNKAHAAYRRIIVSPAARQAANITALNDTEILETFRWVMQATLKSVRRLRNASAWPGQRLPEVIFKSQSPAHPGCEPFIEKGMPQPFLGFDTHEYSYNWKLFPDFDKEARAVSDASDGDLHFLNVSMLYERPDGHVLYPHNEGADCLHYCTPGPLDAAARQLQHMLFTSLPERASW